MEHYVYKITNLKNGNFYIGSRSHPQPQDDSYMSSSKVMKNLYKIEGIKNFNKEILKEFHTREEANIYEDLLINKALNSHPNVLYNLRRSGCKDNNQNIFNKRNDIWGDFYKEIRNQYLNGVKSNSLAKLYNCDRGTIDSVIKDLITDSKWSQAWGFEKEILMDYSEGNSRVFLSKKYKCDIGTIKSILLKNHIKIKSAKEQYVLNKQKGITPCKKKEVNINDFKKLYLIDNLPLKECALHFNIYVGTLKRIAIDNHIPIKSRVDTLKSRKQRHEAWNYVLQIKEDTKTLNKAEILKKYNVKDYKTLNSILNS